MIQDWDGMELSGKLLINLCKTLVQSPECTRMQTHKYDVLILVNYYTVFESSYYFYFLVK